MESVLKQLELGQTPDQLDEILVADHQALEMSFRRLMGKLEGGDPDAIRAGWCSLERELEAHLEAEEKYILPKFAREYPAEAARIRSEHVQIRSTVLQLGVDLDLHSLRDETAALFISTLRGHAEREEMMFYRWTRHHVSQTERHAIIAALQAIRALFRSPRPDAHDQDWR